jgi:predicted DNA binding protein
MRVSRNSDIRQYAKSHNVALWEIARELGIADSALSRKLREELNAEQKAKVKAIIDSLAE